MTGGAGFIGSHLVDRLVQSRAGQIRVYDNFSRGREDNLTKPIKEIELIRGDITNRDTLRKTMHGVDLVYHLAAQSNVLGAVSNPDSSFASNVVGTYEVLSAALSCGVKRVVFTSSREIYGEPTSLPVPETAPIAPKNAYGVSKAAGEMYCHHFATLGLETVILRLTNVYGSRDFERVIPLFIEQALAGKDLTVYGRRKILDFLWIEDLVEVLCAASFCPVPDSPVNVGSGKGVNLIDLATRIRTLTGDRIAVHVGDERAPEVGCFVADIAAARKHFGTESPEDPISHIEEMLEQSRMKVPV